MFKNWDKGGLALLFSGGSFFVGVLGFFLGDHVLERFGIATVFFWFAASCVLFVVLLFLGSLFERAEGALERRRTEKEKRRKDEEKKRRQEEEKKEETRRAAKEKARRVDAFAALPASARDALTRLAATGRTLDVVKDRAGDRFKVGGFPFSISPDDFARLLKIRALQPSQLFPTFSGEIVSYRIPPSWREDCRLAGLNEE